MMFYILSSGNNAFEIDGFASIEVTKYDGLACPMTIYTHTYIYMQGFKLILKGFK